MSARYTPGPWKVFRVKDGANKGKVIGIGDADAGGITDPFGGLWRSGKELEANAELIAAAPDLLDALQRIAADPSNVATIMDCWGRAAIAKAVSA